MWNATTIFLYFICSLSVFVYFFLLKGKLKRGKNGRNGFIGSEGKKRKKWALFGVRVYLGLMFGHLFGANGWC